MKTSLEGIKVLDLSRVLAGPWAGQLLGDYGADVVKIERPGQGDDTRCWGPPWLGSESAYFLSTNRNKRSVAVDLSTPRGQQVIRDLAREADVLLENFRVGTLVRYGLDPQELMAANPGLIVCSISAFGQRGGRAAEPGYDAMIQASAGLMSITGAADEDGGGPQKVGVAVADLMAGMYAATAVLAALHARASSGRGQLIDVPLYDSQVAWLANQNMNYLVGGSVPVRMGTAAYWKKIPILNSKSRVTPTMSVPRILTKSYLQNAPGQPKNTCKIKGWRRPGLPSAATVQRAARHPTKLPPDER